MSGQNIQLGNRVRDRVSGFTGIAVSRIIYLNGCIQLCVQPPVTEENKRPSTEWIDVHQLEYVDEGVRTFAPGTGGPTPLGTPGYLRGHP